MRSIDTLFNQLFLSQALDILIRQMNYQSADIVMVVLEQLDRSAVWKYRVDAIKLLVHLGVRCAMPTQALGDRVFELLERRLWDEPNKVNT